MYAMPFTRPDLSFTVYLLSRHQIKSNKELWQMPKKIRRYIKGSTNLKLIYKPEAYQNIITYKITGFVDTDWSSDTID